LHGGPGSGSHWLEKFFGDYLEQHFQMIYLDQRGVCRSSSPKDNNYSLERMILDFEEVREALGIGEWLTLGHSFGGILQMAYSSQKNDSIMNSSYRDIANWNNDFSAVALDVKEYWTDYTAKTPKVRVPVLFFYGYTDWMIGPKHYMNIRFPDMTLWGSDVGHIPFLENREDLEKAIDHYNAKHGF
jgi:pimeloyl-ACP methyl ester carboxylesterase